MSSESTLLRVGLMHAALVAVLGVAFFVAGLPLRGVTLGGGVMALSFLSFWGIGRALVVSRRAGLVTALGSLKVLTYLVLVAAVLSGRLVVDGAGFAAGVASFVVATVVVALAGMIPGAGSDSKEYA